MLRSYLTIAWRNIIRHPFNSLINIIGLSAGIAFTLLISGYTLSQLEVNKYLKNIDNQYIIQSKWKDPNMGTDLTTLGYLPRALKERYPNLVRNYYRWLGMTSNVSVGNKHFREGLQLGDSSLINMYGFELAYGNAASASNDPFTVLMTEDKAIKYFGTSNAVGQMITIENFSGEKHDFIISGVLKKPLKNSITDINSYNNNELFLSNASASFFKRKIDDWNNIYIMGFIEIQKGINFHSLDLPMQRLVKLNADPGTSNNLVPFLIPLKDYYLNDNHGLVRKMIFTLSIISFFILIMAIINFVNLSISQSLARMREIGVRKVMGGLRKQLILQFLTESTITVLIATIAALAIYQLARPLISSILGNKIFSLFNLPFYFLIIPAGLLLIVGLIAGVYPAFILSSFKVVESLKGKLRSYKENIRLRKGLVAFQYCTAAIIITCAIIISQQLNLFFGKDLGYNKDFLIYAQLPRNWSPKGVSQMESVREQLSHMSEVKDVTLSFEIPNGMGWNNFKVGRMRNDPNSDVASQSFISDAHYLSTYNIHLKAGNFFNPLFSPGDSSKIVVNETLAKTLGWNDPIEAVGRTVNISGFDFPMTIQGVVNDFHFDTMEEKIQPSFFFNVNYITVYRYMSMKLRQGDLDKDVESISKKWRELMPDAPFEYNFMDDALKQLYEKEIQLKKASYTSIILSLIIVFLGVLGLISSSIQKRKKEIGIRKVIGSSNQRVIGLFLKDYIWVITIACIVSCPITYYFMGKWLENYAYRIGLTVFPFFISIIILTGATILLIVIQTFKTAISNPLRSLRTE